MSKRLQVEARRAQVWDLLMRGVSQAVIAKTLNVHRNTIMVDVRYLREKHGTDVQDSDVHMELGDAIAKFDEIFRYAMGEYSTADKPTHRAAFLEKALMAMKSKVQLLVETGVLPKAANEITGKLVIEGVDISKASLQELKTLRNRMVSQLSASGEFDPDKN